MQWDLFHQRWISISNVSPARQALYSTALFIFFTWEWAWILGSLMFPARPLHHYDPGPLKPCACILHRIPELSPIALTLCTQEWGMVWSKAFPKEGGSFAPCLWAVLPVSIVQSLGWRAAAVLVGLSTGSKQPNKCCHRSVWLFDCMAVSLLGNLSSSPFREGINFVVGITPRDNLIPALGI